MILIPGEYFYFLSVFYAFFVINLRSPRSHPPIVTFNSFDSSPILCDCSCVIMVAI
jgi:hypothetical protein